MVKNCYLSYAGKLVFLLKCTEHAQHALRKLTALYLNAAHNLHLQCMLLQDWVTSAPKFIFKEEYLTAVDMHVGQEATLYMNPQRNWFILSWPISFVYRCFSVSKSALRNVDSIPSSLSSVSVTSDETNQSQTAHRISPLLRSSLICRLLCQY